MGRPLIRLLKRLTSVSAPLSARTTGYVGSAEKLGSKQKNL